MSPTHTEPSYLTLRLLCANAAGMVGFLLAYVVARELPVAIVAGLLIGAIGYVASSVVVEYASADVTDRRPP
ncbi:hypothetical protein [Halorubrum vacuolatum]|uniref:Uncharacterized protein n=1 Tax=Halorubrum vacuolatum TaxID=63740 RepID=A0A238VFK9_HALVU|nr:hypothetical protein [Halorubrum vacuolatum]SNR32299.1 hypothetical protein SAMN06264855_102295 [Halorubrum vacuolatum]